MLDIEEAIKLAFSAFKEELGKDAKLEEGDEVVFQFDNCVLIISLENNRLKEKFIGGLPIRVNHALNIYESEV